MKFKVTIKNIAKELEDRTGSNYTTSRDLESDDATIDNISNGTVTLNEAILDRLSISAGDPFEIFGGAAEGEYHIDTITDDQTFEVVETIPDASDGDVSIYTYTELPLPEAIAVIPSITTGGGENRQVMDPLASRDLIRNDARLRKEVINLDSEFVQALQNLVHKDQLEITKVEPLIEKDADDLNIREQIQQALNNYDELSGVATVSGTATKTVTLPKDLPNADYRIKGLVLRAAPGTAGHPWVTNKTKTSFDLNFADGSYSGDVEYTLELDI